MEITRAQRWGTPGIRKGAFYSRVFCNYGAFNAPKEEYDYEECVCLENVLKNDNAHLWHCQEYQEAQIQCLC